MDPIESVQITTMIKLLSAKDNDEVPPGHTVDRYHRGYIVTL
jgi:hypothetical protein